MKKLRDRDIREVLIAELERRFLDDDNTKIVNEMGVLHGQSRVDIAVINGILHGYEIKSESDTLERLPSQVEDYNKVFDRITLVVSSSYLEKAKNLIPNWWGITVVRKKGDEIKLRSLRKGRINKNVNPYSIVQLLWKDEVKELLKEKGLERGYLSKPKYKMYEHLVQSLELEVLKEEVSKIIRERENWI